MTETRVLVIAAAELSTGKQAVMHCLGIVYEYYTAGSHIIIGLARTVIYG